jgi:hypothetical protein
MLRVLALLASASAPLAAQGALPFSDGRWEFRGAATVDTVDGRESVRFESGFAYRRDVRLEDGTIDADVMVTRRRSFVYVAFRMQDDGEYQGQSAWQLYHGPGATAAPSIEPGVWHRLRIVLSGRRAAVFLGDTTTPILLVPRLAREPRPGYIAIRGFLPPGTPGTGPIARFANVRVRPGVVPFAFGAPAPEPTPASGVIREWTVGQAFAAPDTALTSINSAWLARSVRIPAEPGGLVALHRLVRMPEVTRDVGVVARVRVTADAPVVRRLDLGFSDAVTVLLNGRPIFHGDDSYSFQDRRDGLIAFDQAALYLPLRAGRNELAVIVTDRFGGWGLMGRFPDMRGLRVEPF